MGGVWQGIEDANTYPGIWSNDPGLAWQRVGANAGANATVGLAGGVTAGGIAWGIALIGFTPPGEAVLIGGIAVTVLYDIWWGDDLKGWIFNKFDLNLPQEKDRR